MGLLAADFCIFLLGGFAETSVFDHFEDDGVLDLWIHFEMDFYDLRIDKGTDLMSIMVKLWMSLRVCLVGSGECFGVPVAVPPSA